MAKKFIATYDDSYGKGDTLEKAFQDLSDNYNYWKPNKDDTEFFEGEQIQVEFKITKKETPKKVTVIK